MNQVQGSLKLINCPYPNIPPVLPDSITRVCWDARNLGRRDREVSVDLRMVKFGFNGRISALIRLKCLVAMGFCVISGNRKIFGGIARSVWKP
jgi:hypothetical protein